MSEQDVQAVQDWIGKQIAGRDVVLFMKGTKSMPQCGFSMQVAQILSHLGVDFADINVLDDMSVREGVKVCFLLFCCVRPYTIYNLTTKIYCCTNRIKRH